MGPVFDPHIWRIQSSWMMLFIMGTVFAPCHGTPNFLEHMSPSFFGWLWICPSMFGWLLYAGLPLWLISPPLATLPLLPPIFFGVSQTGGARYSPPSSGPHPGITPPDAPSGDPSVGARPLLANLCRYYRNDPLMWKWGSCWRLLRTVEDRSRLPEGIYHICRGAP